LLPSLAANEAGLGISGADPAFAAGRAPVADIAGARTRAELLDSLRSGSIKAALVIGEDPIAYDRTAAYFSGADFLAAVDWAATETTLYADVAIPASTYLEEAGTRCTFEGRAHTYSSLLEPPGGQQTWQVLRTLALKLGLDVPEQVSDITEELAIAARRQLGELLPYYWNDGQRPSWLGRGRLVVADVEARPSPRTPALSVVAHRRREVREVGIREFLANRRRPSG
jgi:assimilatory nitrate reductase catalytic subunit